MYVQYYEREYSRLSYTLHTPRGRGRKRGDIADVNGEGCENIHTR